MTDLMLINKSFKIAIEGKYTEYSESHYETIKEWNRDNEDHKNKIKENWFSYLKDCQATNITELISGNFCNGIHCGRYDVVCFLRKMK